MHALSRRNRSGPVLAALALSMLAVLAGPAVAAEDADADARLQKYTVELKEHEVADTRHAATSEIGKAEALRDKALTLVKKRKDRDALGRTLDELEATLAMIGAKITHAEAKAKLDGQKAESDKVKAELAKVKAAADKLEQQQQELEKRLGGAK
jgi:hypothetical protein